MIAAAFSVSAPIAAAANKPLPFQDASDDPLPAQIDGTSIYSRHVTMRSPGHRSRRYSIVRFDTATGRSHVVFKAREKLVGAFRVGGGRLVAQVEVNSRTLGIVNVPLDGSARTTMLTARWRTFRGSEGGLISCGTYITPSSITADGYVVIEKDTISCRSNGGPRKFLIVRPNGSRVQVGEEFVEDSDVDGLNNPLHTQLVGDRLLASDDALRTYGVPNGPKELAWLSGVDFGVIAPDGSLWLSVNGSLGTAGYWSALTRGVMPLDTPTALASSTADGESEATRYLPLVCGDNVLVTSGRISAYDEDMNGGEGVFGSFGNLRLGGTIILQLFGPDGTAIRTLPTLKMFQVTAVGCDTNGVTLAGRGKKRDEYARVTF